MCCTRSCYSILSRHFRLRNSLGVKYIYCIAIDPSYSVCCISLTVALPFDYFTLLLVVLLPDVYYYHDTGNWLQLYRCGVLSIASQNY